MRSGKEPLKLRDQNIQNKIDPFIHADGNFHAFCGSLIERYTREELSIHLHLFGKRSRINFCVAVKNGHGRSGGQMGYQLAANLKNIHLRRQAAAKHREQYAPVFIDVHEFLNNPQLGFPPILPKVIRLQSFDLRDSIRVDTKQPLAFTHRIPEQISAGTNGKHIVFCGLTVRSEHEFPHQVIKGGPEILQAITNNQPKPSGHWAFGFQRKGRRIIGAIFISHHMCWVAVKVPMEFGFERLRVKYGPEDFLSDAIK